MGIGGCAAQGAAAHLQHHDGLFAADPLQGLGQLTAVAAALHIDADDPGGVVGLEIVQQVHKVHIGHVADGDELVIQHRLHPSGALHQDGAGQSAALGDEGDAAGLAEGREGHAGVHEGGIHQAAVVDDADAVGAHHPDAVFLRRAHQAGLAVDALGGLGLGVVRRGADDELYIALFLHAAVQIVHDAVDHPGGHDQDHQVHMALHLRQGGGAGIAQDLRFLGIHRIHLSGVALFPHVADRHKAGLPRVGGSAHHGDAVRLE